MSGRGGGKAVKGLAVRFGRSSNKPPAHKQASPAKAGTPIHFARGPLKDIPPNVTDAPATMGTSSSKTTEKKKKRTSTEADADKARSTEPKELRETFVSVGSAAALSPSPPKKAKADHDSETPVSPQRRCYVRRGAAQWSHRHSTTSGTGGPYVPCGEALTPPLCLMLLLRRPSCPSSTTFSSRTFARAL